MSSASRVIARDVSALRKRSMLSPGRSGCFRAAPTEGSGHRWELPSGTARDSRSVRSHLVDPCLVFLLDCRDGDLAGKHLVCHACVLREGPETRAGANRAAL